MIILQVSESDNIGGAAVAASRLNKLLNKYEVLSELVVSRKKTTASQIIAPSAFYDKMYAKLIPHIIIRINRWKFGTTSLSVLKNKSSFFFNTTLKNKNFDLVNLHWVNNGFVGLDDLHRISVPIVWTLHDTWLFTAGCHSTQGCIQFTDSCGSCPKLGNKNLQSNLNKQFREKKNIIDTLNSKVSIVVPSRWMLESAKNSKLLSKFDVNLIPNFIDTELFRPEDKLEAQEKVGLDTTKKYLLFGASDPINDSNKGFHFIKEMANLGALIGYTLIIFGAVSDPNAISIDVPFIIMNQIDDQKKLVSLYNSVELLLMPSIHESFGQVAAEAMSCNIPVLCFKTTGLIDVVDHQSNGYLASLGSTKDLIAGFNWITAQGGRSMPAREKIEKSFSKKIVAEKYLTLYKRLLKNKKHA